MAQFTMELFNNIPPSINNLNHNKQEILRCRFRSAYFAQSQSVQELAFIKNVKKKKPYILKIE
jgi:hypothetical protein